MQLIRRECFWLFALATGAPLATQAWAQGGPKLTQILRHDLENQDYIVQETVASIVEFPTGGAAPWHMHPSAQELLYVVDGALTVEIEGQGKMLLKEGEATIIAADLVHLVSQRERGGY
jgi:quercetin dioxygenase-like cupin family protein